VANDANACSDGDLCTTDVCSGGACVGTGIVCSNGDVCDGVETCNGGTGTCDAGVAPNCDDFVACTNDSCDPILGCQHEGPAGAPGVMCILDQMRVTLLTAQLGEVAPKLRRRVDRSLAHAQASMFESGVTGFDRQQQLYRATSRRMARIIRTIERALANDRVKYTVALTLIDLAKSARVALAAIIVG
jgi:hypothetical protein